MPTPAPATTANDRAFSAAGDTAEHGPYRAASADKYSFPVAVGSAHRVLVIDPSADFGIVRGEAPDQGEPPAVRHNNRIKIYGD